MLFNSFIFIFVFLPLTLGGYYLISEKKIQLSFLLIASLVFYAYWSPKYVFLLLFTVILDFYVAKNIFSAKTVSRKKILLSVSILANLTILGFFKYFNLFAETANTLTGHFGFNPLAFHSLNLILPIGISFYTFQSMSYVIDVYRGHSDAHASLRSFATYVTLFPHQISGPLVRHNQIVPQLESSATYTFHWDNFWKGCYFFVFGLSKKLLIADLLAVIVSPLVTNMAQASNLEALLAMLGYTLQLYFDFSGYSDMAVGLGLMMNIQFPQNFNSPYKASSITDFWKRWHMTLSSWLRDYLYFSLGGNRDGTFNTYRNLFLTMAIGGLWHGGSWTFAAWGAFHGILLCMERGFKALRWNFINRKISSILTFILVNVGWILFRAPTFSIAWIWIKKVLMVDSSSLSWDLASLPERYKDRFSLL